jgi:hypothetical protein
MGYLCPKSRLIESFFIGAIVAKLFICNNRFIFIQNNDFSCIFCFDLKLLCYNRRKPDWRLRSGFSETDFYGTPYVV